jgi:hypothetical protein
MRTICLLAAQEFLSHLAHHGAVSGIVDPDKGDDAGILAHRIGTRVLVKVMRGIFASLHIFTAGRRAGDRGRRALSHQRPWRRNSPPG